MLLLVTCCCWSSSSFLFTMGLMPQGRSLGLRGGSLAPRRLVSARGGDQKDSVVSSLPARPCRTVIVVVWANSLVLGLVGGAAGLLSSKAAVLGPQFDVGFASAVAGVVWALPWFLVLSLPLEKWFPERFGFLSGVSEHTELFTALIFGAELGGLRRWCLVLLGMLLVSLGAGVCEELLFRGIAQSGLAHFFQAIFSTSSLFSFVENTLLAPALAIATTSLVFGLCHNYCQGYMLLTGTYGLYLGSVFAFTQNLYVPVVAHAIHNLVTFFFSYLQVANASPERKAKLAQRDTPLANALRFFRGDDDLSTVAPEKNTTGGKKIEHFNILGIDSHQYSLQLFHSTNESLRGDTTTTPRASFLQGEIDALNNDNNKNATPPREQNNEDTSSSSRISPSQNNNNYRPPT